MICGIFQLIFRSHFLAQSGISAKWKFWCLEPAWVGSPTSWPTAATTVRAMNSHCSCWSHRISYSTNVLWRINIHCIRGYINSWTIARAKTKWWLSHSPMLVQWRRNQRAASIWSLATFCRYKIWLLLLSFRSGEMRLMLIINTQHFVLYNISQIIQVYTTPDYWDCVATCFFIDCANNVAEFVETIYK